MLAVIAVFVWMAAGQQATMEELKARLHGASVEDAMVGAVQALPPETSLSYAASRLAAGFQHDFPVIDDGRVVGVLTRDDVLRGLATRRPDTAVAELMHRSFPTAGPSERLDAVLDRLPPDGGPVIVVRDDALVGLLDPEHVGAVVAMRGGTSNAHPTVNRTAARSGRAARRAGSASMEEDRPFAVHAWHVPPRDRRSRVRAHRDRHAWPNRSAERERAPRRCRRGPLPSAPFGGTTR